LRKRLHSRVGGGGGGALVVEVFSLTPPPRDDVGVSRPLMLATLTERREFGEDWLLERKFDGERCA
jgi:ATP-dependent DNA ligase